MALGRNSQLTPAALKSPTSIGWSTLTPALVAITPVMAGKMEPPIWPRTKTNAKCVRENMSAKLEVGRVSPIAEERISGEKILDPTEMP